MTSLWNLKLSWFVRRIIFQFNKSQAKKKKHFANKPAMPAMSYLFSFHKNHTHPHISVEQNENFHFLVAFSIFLLFILALDETDRVQIKHKKPYIQKKITAGWIIKKCLMVGLPKMNTDSFHFYLFPNRKCFK